MMGYYELLKKHENEFRIFQLSFLLVTLDKYPEIDQALRKNKPMVEIVDMVINGKNLRQRHNHEMSEDFDA